MATHPQRIGKYEVLSLLGRGGMGVVYKALDPVIDRIVAIKTISTADAVAEGEDYLITRLKLEARSAGRLHHPNIVTVFDFGEENDLAFIVMEYVEGLNLAQVIAQNRPISLTQKLDLLAQICNGLAYAHDLGVVHRDIKPSNVCITSKQVAKLLDFGLARFDTTRLTRTGFMSGTISYMSPERLRGQAGPSDDLFALGVVAYELLTYRHAFEGTTPPEVMYQVMNVTPADASTVADLPQELDPIFRKAMEKEPEKRYATATELANALAEFRQSQAFRDFVGDPNRTIAFQRSVEAFIEPIKPGTHPYSASQLTAPQPADTSARTEIVRDPIGASNDASTTIQPQATLPETPMVGAATVPGERGFESSGEPTQIVPELTSRSSLGRVPHAGRLPLAAAVAVVVVIIAAFLFVEREEPPERSEIQADSKRAADPIPAPAETAGSSATSTAWDFQSALFDSLTAEAGKLELSSGERERLRAAQVYANVARERYARRDYEASETLMSNAISGLQSLITERKQTLPVGTSTARASRSDPPSSRSGSEERRDRKAREIQKPAKTAETVVAAPAAAAPGPVVSTPVAPAVEAPRHQEPVVAPRSAEDPRREIAAFMQRIANAYQSHDVEFFRRTHQNFSESMASGVKSSPSIRVVFQIVDLSHANESATVTVRRTDTFPSRDMPPGEQTLVYQLVKTSGGWSVSAFRRR